MGVDFETRLAKDINPTDFARRTGGGIVPTPFGSKIDYTGGAIILWKSGSPDATTDRTVLPWLELRLIGQGGVTEQVVTRSLAIYAVVLGSDCALLVGGPPNSGTPDEVPLYRLQGGNLSYDPHHPLEGDSFADALRDAGHKAIVESLRFTGE